MDQRTVDLDGAPNRDSEIRLQSDDCRVTIWLPAGARAMGAAIKALSDAGFDIAETPK